MIYIYRRRGSTGARELSETITLLGTRARRTKGLYLGRLTPQDQVVCWGDHFAATPGTKILNNVPSISKFQEAHALNQAGVPTVQVSRTRPVGGDNIPAQPARAAVYGVRPNYLLNGGPYDEAGVRALVERLQNHLNAPLPVLQPAQAAVPARAGVAWLPRKNNHVGGADLLTENLADPDFYSKKEDLTAEFRLHMFKGKSIRAGQKIQRATRPDGRTPSHPWIRSYDAGWVIAYDDFKSNKAQRELAAKALEVLGLDFGAVDIGQKRDGSYIVLEVNRAPGVEGGTTEAYAKKIIEWSKE